MSCAVRHGQEALPDRVLRQSRRQGTRCCALAFRIATQPLGSICALAHDRRRLGGEAHGDLRHQDRPDGARLVRSEERRRERTRLWNGRKSAEIFAILLTGEPGGGVPEPVVPRGFNPARPGSPISKLFHCCHLCASCSGRLRPQSRTEFVKLARLADFFGAALRSNPPTSTRRYGEFAIFAEHLTELSDCDRIRSWHRPGGPPGLR